MARILIVDDSPVVTITLTRMLEKHGHQVSNAENGADGVAKARAEQPDLILMDVVMPGLNGFQATRELSKGADTKDIPVIIVSTKDQEIDRLYGERQGARGYLIKPPQESQLMAMINEILSPA